MGQKKVWKIGAGVLAGGVVFKVAYFNFSRGILVDHTDAKHDKATKALREAREFSRWAEHDRKQREIPITDEQREQMRGGFCLGRDVFYSLTFGWGLLIQHSFTVSFGIRVFIFIFVRFLFFVEYLALTMAAHPDIVPKHGS